MLNRDGAHPHERGPGEQLKGPLPPSENDIPRQHPLARDAWTTAHEGEKIPLHIAHETNPFVGTETARAYVKRRAAQDPEFAVTFAEAYDRRKLARVIREAREHRQLSQAELAKLAGTRQPHIARLENAGASPTLELRRSASFCSTSRASAARISISS